VLCAPAYFSDRQRAALREAAVRAGFQVLRILNAPSAAALAYGAGRGLARKRVLVMDLGASAVDAAVVQITGDDLEVITTGGDPTLGGLDFDARVADMLAALLRAYGGSPSGDVLTLQQLRRAAEQMKVTLSTEEEALMPEVSLGAGAPTEPLPPLSRERLQVVTADLADRVALCARSVLEGAALGPQGLDSVLLVGGLSQSPQVRRRVQELLGVPVQTDVDPLGAPALGAALLGHSLAQAQVSGKPGARVSDVLSMPVGVAERSGALHTVLARNTRLPAEKSLVVQVQPGPVALALFQGPSIVAQDNEFLGTVFLILERGGELQLHFSVSTDGTLALAATLPGGRRQPVTLDARDPGDVARAELVARSPLGQEPAEEPQRQGGLLTGIKKLFGR
jgi:molecular chaperone DnaK